MTDLKYTCLFKRHVELGAQIVEFGGWEMNTFKEAYQKQVRQKVVDLRRDFLQMQYCFSEKDFDGLLEQLQALT